MSTESHIDKIELQGFDYLRDRQWSKALGCFQEMLSLPIDPLRQVKVLRNIMGIYIQEGNNPEAISTARRGLEIIEANDLYENTAEAPDLRGEFRGYITKLEGKPVIPSFTENTIAGPIEQNFSLFDQLRTFFATAIIGSALGAAIGSQLPQQLGVPFLIETTKVFIALGAIIGWFVSNLILEITSRVIHSWTGQDKKSSVNASINLLTFVAIAYAIIMPFLIQDVIVDSGLTILCLFSLLLVKSNKIVANFRYYSLYLLCIVFVLMIYWVLEHFQIIGSQSAAPYKSLPLWMFIVFLCIFMSVARGMVLAVIKKSRSNALFLVLVLGSIIYGLSYFNYRIKLFEIFILSLGFLMAYLYQMYTDFQKRSLIIPINPNESNDKPT